MNWRGRPLTSHDVIVNTIAATTTNTGLSVHAELDTATYPTGVKIPDAQITELHDNGALRRHNWHPEWNYTLNPNHEELVLLGHEVPPRVVRRPSSVGFVVEKH